MLCVLWELFPDHPLLLPAYFDIKDSKEKRKWVSKPCYGREAEGIIYSDRCTSLDSFVGKSKEVVRESEKKNKIPLGPPIYQEYHKIPRWSGR